MTLSKVQNVQNLFKISKMHKNSKIDMDKHAGAQLCEVQ